VELYVFAAFVYFLVCFTGSHLARKLEKRNVRT
jgi:ABC-type amino acid transport system permease subunit